VQAQPAEMPTPSLQALKQRAHQLLESQRNLQLQNQALAAERLSFERERDQLTTQYQELSAERDALHAERDSLTAHLLEITAQRDSIQQQRETLQTTVEELQGQLCAQSAETAEQSQQRDGLHAELNELQAECDVLGIRIQKLTSEYQDVSTLLEGISIQPERRQQESGQSAPNEASIVNPEVNRGGKLDVPNREAEIRAREAEKNLTFLLRKEIQRMQEIIKETQFISGSKQLLTHNIFCIGSNKTGTTSLDSAMRVLGFTTMPEGLASQYLTVGRDEQNQEKAFRCLLETEIDKFNFFEDLPFCFRNNYKVIDEFCPDAKFILTIRQPDNWFSSCIRWIECLDCEDCYSWIWGLRFAVDNKEEIISRYNKRNAEIEDYFSGKPSQLLVIQIEQSNFADLMKFLGLGAGLASRLNFPIDNTNDFKH
jgi:uncharacterized coiled-coil DUF342 family protein/NAD-dependent dihydropyrimidine dehydrogenase PreA subunit